MGRDLSWKPSNHTRICSDHFELKDYNELDLELDELGLSRWCTSCGNCPVTSNRIAGLYAAMTAVK